jgi:hypothetical protein
MDEILYIKEDRIKERNEIAKAIYIKNSPVFSVNAVEFANKLMVQMYGENWDK